MTDMPYRKIESYIPIVALAAILVLITWIGLNVTPGDGAKTWIQILVLMVLFSVIVGRAITGRWRGILIDRRNKMSLSRLQLLVWTLIVLSAIVAAVLTNVTLGLESPLGIEISKLRQRPIPGDVACQQRLDHQQYLLRSQPRKLIPIKHRRLPTVSKWTRSRSIPRTKALY